MDLHWKELLTWTFLGGVLIALIIEEIFLGLIGRLWGWIMFKWKKTTHLGVLGVYWRELPLTKHDDGRLYYEILPGLSVSEGTGWGTRFLVVKLDICNMDSIENLLTSYKAEIIYPKDIMTNTVSVKRAYVNEDDLDKLYLLQQDFKNPIEDLSLPLTLKPGTTYIKHLCLEIANGCELIDGGKVKIVIKDRYGKKSKLEFKFGIEKGRAYIEQ